MEENLKDVNALMGVVGSFICDSEGDLIANAMPETFTAEKLSRTAHVVGQTLQALDASGQRVSELDLAFEGGRLILKTMRGGTLGMLCSRNVHLPLLNMTANVVVKKIAAQLKAAKPTPPREPAAPRKTAPRAVTPPPVPVEPPAPSITATPSELVSKPSAELLAPPLFQELSLEADRILEDARRFRVDLKVMDSLAIWLSSTVTRWLLAPIEKREIWLGGRSVQSDSIPLLFERLGYHEDKRFNANFGRNRLHFVKPNESISVDVYLDAFTMYHRLDLLGYLAEGQASLIETPLLLTRLQLVEISDAGLRDLCGLLIEHDLSVGPEKGKIDASAVTRVCADDWGWYKTVSLNLDRLINFGATTLSPADRALVSERAQRLKQSIATAPKSLRWQTRARLGESVRWYETPITGHPAGRPDMAMG